MRCACCGGALAPPRLSSPDRLLGVPGRFEVAECTDCRSGRTLPPVGEEGLGGFYPESYSPHADFEGGAALASRAIRRWQAARALRTPALAPVRAMSPGRALDVGCGRGDLGATLVGRGWRVAGVEPSPEACEAARRRGVDTRQGTLASVSVEQEAYDLVTFVHSLEHTVDPLQDLRRAAGALRPGGTLAITVPNFASRQARLFASRWFHLDLPRHRHHLTPTGMRRLLDSVPLLIERVATSTSAIGLAASVQYAALGHLALKGGPGQLLAVGLSQTTWPLARAFDLAAGGGDLLHAVARRP